MAGLNFFGRPRFRGCYFSKQKKKIEEEKTHKHNLLFLFRNAIEEREKEKWARFLQTIFTFHIHFYLLSLWRT